MRIKKMGPAREPSEGMNEYERDIWAVELGGSAPETNLHELTKEEALGKLDHDLNREFMEGARVIKIVHGRGTGKLRKAVHDFLRGHELVAYFSDPNDPNQKGGVTYAVLYSKDRASEPRLKGAR